MELRQIRREDGWKVEIVRAGSSISRLWIVNRDMRIGSAVVRVGGLAGVGTDREFRNQGLSRRVLEASVELMEREGYDVSFLFGIPDLYGKFGFATCMPEHRLYIDTRDAERATASMKLAAASEADIPAIARIYNRENAMRTGSVVRHSRSWRGFPMGSFFGIKPLIRTAVDAGGRIRGYVVYDDVGERCRAAEIGGSSPGVFDTILAFLAKRAVRLRRERLSVSAPPDHPFALHCRQFGCRASTLYNRAAGPMGRVLNLHSLMERLLPELQRRLPPVSKSRADLALRTDIGTETLIFSGGSVRLARSSVRGAAGLRLSQDVLMQLLMGYRTVEECAVNGDLRGSAKARHLAEGLFPQQQAHMWWPDRF